MSDTSTSRRRFLKGLGVGMALPFLPSIMRSSAGAQAGRPPKRFIFVFSANGQRPRNWYPEGPPSAWRTLSDSQHVRESPLTGSTFSPIINSDFNAVHSKMLILRGLDSVKYNSGSHNAFAPLSGVRGEDSQNLPSNATIDQLMAQSSAVYESTPPVRSVHMLCKPAHQNSSSTSAADVGGSMARIPHEVNPSATYAKLFGGFVDEGDAEASARTALRQRTLDRVREQYERLRAHPRLSANDRRRLQAHAEMIHDLERRLGVTGPECSRPADPGTFDLGDEMNLPAATQANIDLLVSAIKCDRTRVATLMLCSATDIRRSTYIGSPGEHHELTHRAADEPLARINSWYGSQVADLLRKLDVPEDESSTYLDNSIVFWGNEDGINHQDAHWASAQQVLLAGGGGGQFRTGRYVDYREEGQHIMYGDSNRLTGADYRGRLYNSLLITLMEAMGMSPDEWGGRDRGIGVYGPNYADQYSVADGKIGLPFLT